MDIEYLIITIFPQARLQAFNAAAGGRHPAQAWTPALPAVGPGDAGGNPAVIAHGTDSGVREAVSAWKRNPYRSGVISWPPAPSVSYSRGSWRRGRRRGAEDFADDRGREPCPAGLAGRPQQPQGQAAAPGARPRDLEGARGGAGRGAGHRDAGRDPRFRARRDRHHHRRRDPPRELFQPDRDRARRRRHRQSGHRYRPHRPSQPGAQDRRTRSTAPGPSRSATPSSWSPIPTG